MGSAVYLNVDGEQVLTTQVTYYDLLWLYQDFQYKNGRIPVGSDGKSIFNLPQPRIVKRVLEENSITFNDFMLQLGKVKHVRTESKDYNFFREKYVQFSKQLGHAMTQTELRNNHCGLPSQHWFVKHCPNKDVKTFEQFVGWCGFKSNKSKIDDEFVGNRLIQYEKELGRPIVKSDITVDKIGFSGIVINRIWGGLNEAKRTLGLQKTVGSTAKSFNFYKDRLDKILYEINKNENRKFVSWKDIENPKYTGSHTDHKTYLAAFNKQGVDFYTYIKSQGYGMSPNSMGHNYVFNDGEKVKSTFEFDFSKFLRNDFGFIFNHDYFRDVKYNNFENMKSRINCDYVINVSGIELYIEIAGMIYKGSEKDWRTTTYTSKRENSYRDKMILKESLLLKNGKPFLFLFPRDMMNESYKTKAYAFIAKYRVT